MAPRPARPTVHLLPPVGERIAPTLPVLADVVGVAALRRRRRRPAVLGQRFLLGV
jgi:hypothetical protein